MARGGDIHINSKQNLYLGCPDTNQIISSNPIALNSTLSVGEPVTLTSSLSVGDSLVASGAVSLVSTLYVAGKVGIATAPDTTANSIKLKIGGGITASGNLNANQETIYCGKIMATTYFSELKLKGDVYATHDTNNKIIDSGDNSNIKITGTTINGTTVQATNFLNGSDASAYMAPNKLQVFRNATLDSTLSVAGAVTLANTQCWK